MSIFDPCFAFTLANEGGLKFTASANDKGGNTFAGLTQAVAQTYFGRLLSIEQMKALTKEQVGQIYNKVFWQPLGLAEDIDVGLAAAVFDAAVLTGVGRAAMALQGCLNVKADGKIGPLTLAALRAVSPATLRVNFACAQVQYLYAIAARDATQRMWLNGWLCRAVRPLSVFA